MLFLNDILTKNIHYSARYMHTSPTAEKCLQGMITISKEENGNNFLFTYENKSVGEAKRPTKAYLISIFSLTFASDVFLDKHSFLCHHILELCHQACWYTSNVFSI